MQDRGFHHHTMGSSPSPSVIPEGSVCSPIGFLQHMKESLVISSQRQTHIKAAEGLAKALLAAITNLCLIYTNAPITEADVMLLKATIYAFFFVSACVDTSVYVKLLHLWFTEGPYTVVQKP